MTRRISLLLVTGLALAGALDLAAAKPPDPAALMREAEKRHRVPAERQKAKLTLQAKGGSTRTLSYEGYSAQDDAKGDRMRITFSAPPDIAGTALLSTEDPKARENEQWLYLPAFRRTRRVGEAELGDRFVGTDIYFEDLQRRYVDDYSYTLKGEETIDGKPCYVIESVPRAKKVKDESPYGKSQIWLRKDILFTVQVRHFDRKLKPLKQVVSTDLKHVAGKAWRAHKVEIVDMQKQHRTTMVITEQDNAPTISPQLFSKHGLQTR